MLTKSTQDIINQTLCVLAHVEECSPSKIRDLTEYWSIIPQEDGIPVIEVGGLLEAVYKQFLDLKELSFKAAKIDGHYIKDVMLSRSAELRQYFEQAQRLVAYHPRLILDLCNEIGTAYCTARIQQALNRNDFGKVDYYTTKLKAVNTQEDEVCTSAVQIAKGYISKQLLYGSGITTGIPAIDDVVDYLTYRSLNVLMAPSANFKTTTACSIAYNAAMFQGKNVVYFTLEDFEDVIWHNIIARHSFEMGGTKIASNSLKKYKLSTAEEIELLHKVAEDFDAKLTKGHFTVLCKTSCKDLTPAGIEAKILEVANRTGKDVDMVIIDHFNLLNSPIPSMPWLTGSELQRYYVTSLTNLSITTGKRGFVLLGLAQLNREGQGEFETGAMASSLHVAGTIELLWSATNFIYLFADNTARANGTLDGKIIKSRFSSQGNEFSTPIQPAYCIVGRGAEHSDINNAYNAYTVAEDANKKSKEAKIEALATAQAYVNSGNKIPPESLMDNLSELATLLTGQPIIEPDKNT